MRMAILTTGLIFSASVGAASQIDCNEAVALALSAGALVQTINDMTDLCSSKAQTDETCRRYAQLLSSNDVPGSLAAYAAQTATLAAACPGKP